MYQCKRCGLECHYRSVLLNHLKRKRACDPTSSTVSIVSLIQELENFEEKRYVCKHCSKTFKNKQSKYVHQKNCKCSQELVIHKPTVEELADTVATLQSRIAELEANKGGNTFNNNITQTNNVHIHVTPRDFARGENTTYLEPQFLLECLKEMDLVKVLEELHFNPEHPENHNVRVKNVKQNLMEYTDGGKWVVKKKDEVLDHLVMNGYRVLHTYYKDNKDDVICELDDDEIDGSVQWLKRIYNEDKSVVKQLKDDAFLLVMNNKALLIGK
jgi:hypothetical protein